MTDSVVINTTPTAPTLEEEAAALGIKPDSVDATSETQTAEERPAWLKEKFKTPEDLANAYEELEKKLGTPKEEAPPPVDETTEEDVGDKEVSEDEAKEAVAKAGLDFDELSAKYWEKGSIEEADYAKLEKNGIPRHMVDQFTQGQQAVMQLERMEAWNLVGGEESYGEMARWAANNLTESEIKAYDNAVNGNDKNARNMAIKGLSARFKGDSGFEPGRTVGGKGGKGMADVYDSIAEVQEDMRNPKYGKDPAFTRKVEQKVARSNVF